MPEIHPLEPVSFPASEAHPGARPSSCGREPQPRRFPLKTDGAITSRLQIPHRLPQPRQRIVRRPHWDHPCPTPTSRHPHRTLVLAPIRRSQITPSTTSSTSCSAAPENSVPLPMNSPNSPQQSLSSVPSRNSRRTFSNSANRHSTRPPRKPSTLCSWTWPHTSARNRRPQRGSWRKSTPSWPNGAPPTHSKATTSLTSYGQAFGEPSGISTGS